MKFYSTKQASPVVGLKEALLNGLAPDGGLYMPTEIPRLPDDFFTRLSGKPFQEVAQEASVALFGDDVPADVLEKIVQESFNFDVPLVPVGEDVYALELFHGPTGAFKDFAARFMARLFAHLMREDAEREITVLVATSGDTGGAVAHGFLGVPGVRVVILYPSGKVSPLQERQLTTMGGNVTALEVKGSFDDCQRMVKEAFQDTDIQQALQLVAANSINIGRLLPQALYHLYIATSLGNAGKPIVVSVPSGNFGNLTAGLIAKRMGAPIAKHIAATNQNDAVPRYLKTGAFEPKETIPTISNAMDIGNPSNFARMLELYGHDWSHMREDIYGASFSDEQTKQVMKEVFKAHGYQLDPHGAVAYLGLREYREQHPDTIGVFLETAHPVKFAEVVKESTGVTPAMPANLKDDPNRPKQSVVIDSNFVTLKDFLLRKSR